MAGAAEEGEEWERTTTNEQRFNKFEKKIYRVRMPIYVKEEQLTDEEEEEGK